MRYLVLALAASSLALSGCGKKEATGNTAAVDEGVTAQDFVTNDVTAIDAATGADANMAADVDIEVADNGDGNGSRSSGSSERSRPRGNSSASNASSNAVEPAETPPAAAAATQPAETNTD